MATPTLNLELLAYFAPLILFILVFTLIYAMFQWAKILGDNKVIHSVIAFFAAIFVAFFSEGARNMVSFMIPWFTVLAILMVFAIMLYKVFGATDADVRSVIQNRTDIQWTLFIVIIIIVLGALAHAFGQNQLTISTGDNVTQNGNLGNPGTGDTASGDFNQNLGATFYHPKVLGMLFLFIVGAITVAFLAQPIRKV